MSHLAPLAHPEDACANCIKVRGRPCCTMPDCDVAIDFYAQLALDGDAVQATTGHRVNALADIAEERRRQVEVEGFTTEHDDRHSRGELAGAGACYALAAVHAFAPQVRPEIDHALIEIWPLPGWLKPTTPRRDLVKAAALIVAEIERIDRAEARAKEEGGE